MEKISLVVTKEQKTKLQQEAKAHGVSLNKYILSFVFPAESENQTDQNNQQSSIADIEKILAAIKNLEAQNETKNIEKYVANINQIIGKLAGLANLINAMNQTVITVDQNTRRVLNAGIKEIYDKIPDRVQREYLKQDFIEQYSGPEEIDEDEFNWTNEQYNQFLEYCSKQSTKNQNRANDIIPV